MQGLIDIVTFESAIDGQTGTSANQRHSLPKLIDLANRTIVSLRSLVSEAGHMQYLDESAPAVLGAPPAGETFLTVPYPDGAYEVHGVDVLMGSDWVDLDPISFQNRRLVTNRTCRDRVGYWAIKKMPRENGASIDAGEIAIFPSSLGGSYKVWYLKPWIPISQANKDIYKIIVFPDWLDWITNHMTMVVCGKRDKNKKDIFLTAKDMKMAAESKIRAAARRIQRQGPKVPMRRDGLDGLV